MQKLFVWAFSVTSFCSGISCEEGLSDCRTELFVFVGNDGRQKVLVVKYKFVGNIQAAATSPRSLNSVLKLRGNRDVEVESNQLSLERKYLWLTGSCSLSTTAAYTASKKKTKFEGSQKLFFGHYCEKRCWFTNRRNAKKQLLGKRGQNLAGKAVFDLEQKRRKTAYKDFVAKLEFSHQKKMKKSPS